MVDEYPANEIALEMQLQEIENIRAATNARTRKRPTGQEREQQQYSED